MSKSVQPMSILGRKWAPEVVNELEERGTVRYGDLRDDLGIPSDATLANRLSELHEAGIISREQFDEIPPRVEYQLTEDGAACSEHMHALRRILKNGGEDDP